MPHPLFDNSGPRPLASALMPAEFRGHLSFLLARARQLLADDLDEVAAAHGLSIRHVAVLGLLHRRDGMRQTDIGAIFGMDRTTTMKLISDLEARGYVRRAKQAQDQRANAIGITAAGRHWRERLLPHIVEREQRFLSPLTQGESALLLEWMLRIVTAADERVVPGDAHAP